MVRKAKYGNVNNKYVTAVVVNRKLIMINAIV